MARYLGTSRTRPPSLRFGAPGRDVKNTEALPHVALRSRDDDERENEFSTSESGLVGAIPFVFFGSLLGTIDDLFPRASDFDEAVG
jgi:hypothetical protein